MIMFRRKMLLTQPIVLPKGYIFLKKKMVLEMSCKLTMLRMEGYIFSLLQLGWHLHTTRVLWRAPQRSVAVWR